MAVTHPTNVRNALGDACVDLVDAGTAAGSLNLLGGAADLVSNAMSDPAYGATASGTATSNAITNGTCTTAGTATSFEVRDSAAADVFYGSVGTTGSGADLELSSVVFAVNDILQVSALDYIAPV